MVASDGCNKMSKARLAILCSHPIQYYVPVFCQLAAMPAFDLRVFYTWSQSANGKIYDTGFGTELQWDIPLLEGYSHEFVENISSRPGTDRFGGLRNPGLNSTIAAWRPDALLAYGWCHQSHLRALRYFKGRIPVLFRGDSTLLDRRSPLRSLARRVALRWIYQHVDWAVAVGQNSRDYFAWCGIPMDRIVIAPHSVDTARFADPGDAAQERRALAWRQELGISQDQVVIVYAGKLHPRKGVQLLLNAFLDQKADIRTGPRLVFIGNGPQERDLRAQAGRNGSIHFLPFQNQSVMPAVYRLGDVCVLPSLHGETWGLALNEAMASGRTIIASSKVGAARDVIREGINGWTFAAGDLDSLSGVLRRSINLGRAQLRSMGAVGCQLAASWSTEECAQQIAMVVARATHADHLGSICNS